MNYEEYLSRKIRVGSTLSDYAAGCMSKGVNVGEGVLEGDFTYEEWSKKELEFAEKLESNK